MFEEHYKALAEAAVEVAERIRAPGFNTPGTLKEFLEFFLFRKTFRCLLAGSLWWIIWWPRIKTTHKKIALAQEKGDEGTADLYIRRMLEHEKAVWFLRSHIS